MAAKVIKAGENLRVTIPVKNTGTGAGNFIVMGNIHHKDGRHAGTLVYEKPNSTQNGSSSPSEPITAGETLPFKMVKLNWADNKPEAFDHQELFDCKFQVSIEGITGSVSPIDYNAVQHNRGYGVPPKPSSPYLISTTASSSTQAKMKVGWTAVVANPVVTSWELYRAGKKVGTFAANVLSHEMSGLIPDYPYNFYVKAINSVGGTSSDSVNFKTAAWIPAIGDAVPKLNRAKLSDENESRVVYPNSTSKITIVAGDTVELELWVQNVGEGDGEIKVEAQMYYSGTSNKTGTFVDSSTGKNYYRDNFQQGLETPVFMEKVLSNDPNGFANGQLFDLWVTLTAIVGTGKEQVYIPECMKWDRGAVIINPPTTKPTLNVTVSGATATASWNGPADADTCQLTNLAGDYWGVPKSGSYQFGSTSQPLAPGNYTVKCRGVNAGGPGPAETKPFTIQPGGTGTPPAKPNIMGYDSGPYWVEFLWGMPSGSYPNGTIFLTLNDGQKQDRSYQPNSGGVVRFSNLQADTKYTVTVWAVTSQGVVSSTSSAWRYTTPQE